jgi:hypothetical protein
MAFYGIRERDYGDTKQQQVNSNQYSLVYVWYVCLIRQLFCFDSEGCVTWQKEQISMYLLFVLLL